MSAFKRAVFLCVLAGVGLIASRGAYTAEPSASPGTSVIERLPVKKSKTFQPGNRSADDLKRDALDHPEEVLRLAGIKPGMYVIDFLAGDGYYSELLSNVVGPSGHVLMYNNPSFEKWSVGNAAKRVADNRLPNVEHQVAPLNSLQFPPASVDAVFLIKVYHDLYWVDPTGDEWPKVNTSAVLDNIARAVKPGGVLVIVDHSAKPGTGMTAASSLHRIDEAYARQDWESRGLKLVGHSDVLRNPADERDQISYKPPALGHTDRFLLIFQKS
jgi:predicted methyltransferase